MADEFAEIAAYYDDLYVKPERYEREAGAALSLVDRLRWSPKFGQVAKRGFCS